MTEEDTIQVSIICCTYNQESYIADAIESFLMQKTDFNYEILIQDDASTDGTASVIRSYQKNYPNRIRAIYQKENQHSKHNSPLTILIQEAKGRYLALCEGDDYWTDKNKLQKQFDALEAHPECDICAHAANMVDAESKSIMQLIDPLGKDGILTMEQIISGGGNYVATASLFFRKSFWDNRKSFTRKVPYDYCIQMDGAIRGGMLYLKDNMASYRRGAKNSWTMRMKNHKAQKQQHLLNMIDLLDEVDQETSFKYTTYIKYEKLKYRFDIACLNRNIKEIYSKKYHDIRHNMNNKKKLILFLNCFFPGILNGIVILKGKLCQIRS